MKLSRGFIVLVIIIFALMLLVNISRPRVFNWNDTFSYSSTEPFGCKLYDSLMRASTPNGYSISPLTINEWAQIDTCRLTYLIVGDDNLYADSLAFESIKLLLNQGNNVVIAFYASTKEEKNLGYKTLNSSYFWFRKAREDYHERVKLVWESDGAQVLLPQPLIGSEIGISDEFTGILTRELDSYEQNNSDEAEFSIVNDDSVNDADSVVIEDPVDDDGNTYDYEYNDDFNIMNEAGRLYVAAIRPWGNNGGKLMVVGNLYLFSNIAVINPQMRMMSMRLMSQVSNYPIVRLDATLNDNEEINAEVNQAYFRAFLMREPLRWALYLALFTLLVGMIFTARRRQRIIPVIAAPVNYTMAMVKHIGTLYYLRRDHHDLIDKKYLYFADNLRRRAMVDIDDADHFDSEIEALAVRTGMDRDELRSFIRELYAVRASDDTITDRQLASLIDRMNEIEKRL